MPELVRDTIGPLPNQFAKTQADVILIAYATACRKIDRDKAIREAVQNRLEGHTHEQSIAYARLSLAKAAKVSRDQLERCRV